MGRVITKKFLSCVLAFLMILSIVPMNLVNILNANAATSGFYVDGTTIRDGNGNAFVMRGVNIPHEWFPVYTSTSIKAAAQKGANTVRVVCSDGEENYYEGKTTEDELKSIINTCKKNKVICVLEVHDPTGKDDVNSLNNAVNYWIEMKSVLQGNEDYVIVNIANEWYGSWNNAQSWADGYKTAIKNMRNAGIENMLMVDAEGYGQWPSSIFSKGTEVFNADTLKNTVFAIHMYETAGKNSTVVKSNIDRALALNIPVVIGEFAADHNGQDVDEATIMSYCNEKSVGYLGWSWKGNDDNLKSLDIAEDWQGTTLTTWGKTLFNSTYGITNTSKVCTIFNGTPTDTPIDNGTLIAQGGAATLDWETSYAVDFNLTGYKTAKIVVEAVTPNLKLAVDPGWDVIAQVKNVGDTYTYTFSADEIAKYSAKCKLYVQGDGNVSSVKIYGSNGTTSSSTPSSSSSKPSSSSSKPSSSSSQGGNTSSDSTVIAQKGSGSLAWDTSYSIDFSLAGYKSAKVVFTGNAGAFKLAVDPGWTELVETSNVSGSYTYTFTPAQIAAFSGSHKLVVQGQDGSISNVKIIGSKSSTSSDSSSSKPDSSSNTDSSSTASSDSKVIAQKGSGSLAWDTSYSIDFSLAGYKSAKVVFTGNAGALKLAVDPGWTELAEVADVNGSYTYTFTSAQIAAFSGSHKLYVQGQDGSISNVKILASTGSSVSDNPTPVLPEIVGEPEVAQMSITLTGIIGANVLYSIPEGYVNNYYNIEAVFSAPGVTSVTVPLNKRSYQMINGKKAYIFTLPIKPCDMNKEFNARLVIKKASDGTNAAPVLRNTVVLADYVNAYALSTDPIKKAFGQAMQTYGYYAQKNFNPDEELPNIKLINLNDVTVSTVADYEADVRPYRGTKKAEILQTTLYLDSGTGIRTYITDIDSSVDKSNLYMQYTVNGVSKRVKVQTNASGDYYGEISDVPANNLSKMYEIKFLEGTTQITDTSMYGAFSYIYSTLRSTASADTKNLAKVLYKYAIAAEAIIPESSDNSGLDTTVTPSTNENFGDYIGTIPNVDISGSKLYSQDDLVKNFGSFGNLYDKSMYENGSGSNVGIIFAGWNEENYFNDPSLDFKLNFFAEGGDYNIRRMTFVPTYYLATYDEGIKLNDSHTLTPSQQAEIMSEALKMGVRLNYRLHIDPWRFAWGSESYSEVNPDIPGSQWWRGMFTEIHPMADDYMGMINQGFEALEETFAKIGNTKLAEPVRFDIGAELMTSIKRYSDEWVELAKYCKERINASAALRGNVVIGFNFCHHVEYLLEIEDHEDYFNRVTASGESYEDHLDILYVDDMNQQERENMADFIRSLDVFSVSQYMPMDIFEPADKTDPNAVTTTPEDVRDALLTHEQNFLQKVLIGKLGIAPEDIPPMSIGEYGMGIKGLTAPNVWETDNWDASELVTYEAQKKHVEIAIKGLLLYMQDERTVAKSLTIWISGAPYDFLNFYPSMNLGHGPEGSSPAQGYPGKEAFNPPAAQALIDYCGGTKKVY